MSTKAHFIYEEGIDGYEETSEPQSIFGSFTGYNVYLTLDFKVLESVNFKGEYLYIETKNTKSIPSKIKIWGDSVIEFWIDSDGLLLWLKGGHHITKRILQKDFPIDDEPTINL